MNVKIIPLEVALEIRKIVMYPDLSIAEQKVETDDSSVHLGVEVDGMIVSVISLFEINNELQFRKFATLQSEQGKGYGQFLLQYVFEYAKAKKYSAIWCNARMNAAGFYARFGMAPSGETWWDKGFEFVKMRIDLQTN